MSAREHEYIVSAEARESLESLDFDAIETGVDFTRSQYDLAVYVEMLWHARTYWSEEWGNATLTSYLGAMAEHLERYPHGGFEEGPETLDDDRADNVPRLTWRGIARLLHSAVEED